MDCLDLRELQELFTFLCVMVLSQIWVVLLQLHADQCAEVVLCGPLLLVMHSSPHLSFAPGTPGHLASWPPNFVSQLGRPGFLLSAFWLGSFLWAISCGSFRVYTPLFPMWGSLIYAAREPISKKPPPPPHIFCLYLSYFRWEAQSGPCYSILIGNRSPYL